MFPTVLVFGLAGILMGILNAYDHFALPAIAPIVWNLVIIAGVVIFSSRLLPPHNFSALAWAVLIGAVVEVVIQVPAVFRRREGPLLEPVIRDPAVRQVGVLLGPVILSLGIVNFNALVDTIVASLISDPAPAYIDKAFRLFQLPQGMFAVAIGTVVFPTLSRLAALRRFDEFRSVLNLGLRQIFFVTLPFTAFFLVLGEPTVRLIYQHGKVTPAEAHQVAWALTFFSLGMAFVSGNTLLTRAFYGIQKAWLPLVVGGFNLALNALLDLALYRPLGVGGITLSTSMVSTFNFVALFLLLRHEIGGLRGRGLLRAVLSSVVALVPLAAGSFVTWWVLATVLGGGNVAQLVTVSAAYVVGGLCYLGTARLLHMNEVSELSDVIRRRRSTAGPPAAVSPGPE
jgi:putative peptidoglycan lipid II flippase